MIRDATMSLANKGEQPSRCFKWHGGIISWN